MSELVPEQVCQQGSLEIVDSQPKKLPLMGRIDVQRENHPYAATALETIAVWAGREAATAVINTHTPIRVGHGWKNSRTGRALATPVLAIAVGILLSPSVEELVCREIPSRKLGRAGREGLQPAIGTAVATLFAAGHAGREAVPLPQFVGGLNYWRLQRTRGFRHAVLSHALHNGLSYGVKQLKGRVTSVTSRD